MPVAMFAIIMGLTGTTIALEKAEHIYGWPSAGSTVLLAVSAVLYTVIALAYLAKLVLHRSHVVAEFNNPIRLSFFPTMSIGMLLLSIASLSHAPGVALVLWAVGSAVQLAFTLVILSNWMHHDRFQIQHSSPAWFIPIVGTILVPVSGIPLGFVDVSWFFFSAGLLMWVPLLAVLLNRFFFHPMLPGKLLPTLFILIAPPAVGFISWTKLHSGELTDAGRILYYFALFTTLLLLTQAKYFTKLPFALPWWAYSFPTAAITIASMVMLEKVGGVFFSILVPVLMLALAALITNLVARTVMAMRRGEICVPE